MGNSQYQLMDLDSPKRHASGNMCENIPEMLNWREKTHPESEHSMSLGPEEKRIKECDD